MSKQKFNKTTFIKGLSEVTRETSVNLEPLHYATNFKPLQIIC